MADSLDLRIVTPEREMVHEQASEVQIPGKDGYLGVLPGHAPLLGELGIGFLIYTVANGRRYMAVHAGFIEIINNHVRVLADAAERAEEIDVERARAAQKRAMEQVINPGPDAAVALAALMRAETRINLAQQQNR